MLIFVILSFVSIMLVSVASIYKTVAYVMPLPKPKRLILSVVLLVLLASYGIFVSDKVLAFLINYVIYFWLFQCIFILFRLPYLKRINPFESDSFKRVFAVFLAGFTFIATVCGCINARNINLTTYTKTVYEKNFEDKTILFLSDIHADSHNSDHIIKAITATCESQNPDVVIIGGDLADNETTKNEINRFAEIFENICQNICPVVFVLGNHDIMPSKNADTAYIINKLESAGVKVLADTVYDLGGITLIGRTESYAGRFGHIRKSIADFEFDKSKPAIVIDHQPLELGKLKNAKIDLSLSGHTHDGQIFPFGTLSGILGFNEMQYGRRDSESYTAIVSSGIGTWGMGVRTQNKCEIVKIVLKCG